ncbi:hypothetical protein HBN63_19955 [Pseudomonas sp. WS 5011]|nr:hypothetical protein [Pseudomonas sp. WS 5011]
MRYFWVAGCSLLILSLAVLLAGQFSGRQSATVALDVGLSVMRLVLPLVLVLMAQELLSHEFERRYFLNTLAYPRSRHVFLFERFFSVAILTIGLLLVMALLLALLVLLVEKGYAQGTPVALGGYYLLTIAFLGVDLLLLTALACLLAVVASTSSFVLIGTFGFMLVARSYGAIIDLLSRDAGVVDNAEGYRAGLGVLGYLLPDLGALDVRMLALYDRAEFLPSDWFLLLLGSVGYAVALLALALSALQRKHFA